ncbi:MAG TPA: hypothetical protein VE397_06570 [Stellaceae bacterium]|jgi:hypothetical protein|nr:hypothetical protein [Stellaceae bacterium]
MRQVLALLLVAGLLGGCGQTSVNQLDDDTVEIMPSADGNADFIALFLNRQTFLYNGDLPADRQHIIASRLKTAGCRDPRMLGERAEEQDGTWSFGRKRIIYYSAWKCG